MAFHCWAEVCLGQRTCLGRGRKETGWSGGYIPLLECQLSHLWPPLHGRPSCHLAPHQLLTCYKAGRLHLQPSRAVLLQVPVCSEMRSIFTRMYSLGYCFSPVLLCGNALGRSKHCQASPPPSETLICLECGLVLWQGITGHEAFRPVPKCAPNRML